VITFTKGFRELVSRSATDYSDTYRANDVIDVATVNFMSTPVGLAMGRLVNVHDRGSYLPLDP
jgi:hypothetical protein